MKYSSAFKRLFKRKCGNRGSVLVTVLVAFLFLSVLITIVLSTVAVNMRMRAIDRKTKDEFYYAEKAMNDIYTGVGQECSVILGKSYNSVLNNYKKKDEKGYNYNDQEQAYKEFVIRYVDSFNKFATQEPGLANKISGYIVKNDTEDNDGNSTSRATLESVSGIKYYNDTGRTTDGDIIAAPEKIRCIVIEGVSVISNPEAEEYMGYVSQVTSDIVISIPWIDFFDLNQTSFDYALMVNHGLYCEESSEVKVNGNLFAGTENFKAIKNQMTGETPITDSSEYGGINIDGATLEIKEAEYVVSGGDINVNKSGSSIGTLKIDSTSNMNNQIWLENLSVKGDDSVVEINGTVFAASDLQIDGNDTTVTLNGSYYGYNNGNDALSMSATDNSGKVHTISTKEAIIKSNTDYKKALKNVAGEYTENPAARSSSIIVNGKGNKVNLKGLSTLMLLGDAFINHESEDAASNNIEIYKKNGNVTSKISDTELPESVALKSTQGILYVPTRFLNKSNPCTYAENEEDPFTVSQAITESDWFGSRYIDTSVNHHTVKLKQGNLYYAYCYLNFKDGLIPAGEKYEGMSYRDGYVREVMEGAEGETEPTAASIKADILSIAKVYDSQVEVDDGDDTLEQRILTKGAIVEYRENDITVAANTLSKSDDNNIFKGYSENLYKRYRMLDTYAEPFKDIPISTNPTTNNGNYVLNDIDYQDLIKEGNELPMARFFWLGGIRNAVNKSDTDDFKVLCYDLNGVKLVLISAKSGKVTDLSTITDDEGNKIFKGKTSAIVLIDGDSEVSSGTVDINGFVASQGKITVKSGAKFHVTYDAAVISKRVSSELVTLQNNRGYHDVDDGYEGATYGPAKDNTDAKKLLIYYLLDTNIQNSFSSRNPYKLKCTGNNMKNTNSDANKVVTNYRLYKYDNSVPEDAVKISRVNTNYEDYVYFDNWKKGQR